MTSRVSFPPDVESVKIVFLPLPTRRYSSTRRGSSEMAKAAISIP